MLHQPHFLLVSIPAQGHLNPTIQLANRLIRTGGARVTLATSVSARPRLAQHPFLAEGLSLFFYSDGHDDGPNEDLSKYMAELKCHSSKALIDLIKTSNKQGIPFTALVYTLLMPWVADVAYSYNLPSALLWIQPASLFDIYYWYFNGYSGNFANCVDPSYKLNLPGVPLLRSRDLPSFLLPSNVDTSFFLPYFKEQLTALRKGTKPRIFVNTFMELEPEALKAINDKLNFIPIGPLLPSEYLDDNDHLDTSKKYVEWLNSKPKSSVVYVSFGSISILSKPQMEEIAQGLLNLGDPFLWVIRNDQLEKEGKGDNGLSCRKELEQLGMLVPWCSQVEVLSHPSIGCFLTHCGWNSTLESLVSGVPMVGFPQWTDQLTNGKLIEDLWNLGVRMVPNEDGVVESGEVRRCIDLVMGHGEFSEGLRSSAQKWKKLGRDAVKEGGSSNNNLKAFVQEVGQRVTPFGRSWKLFKAGLGVVVMLTSLILMMFFGNTSLSIMPFITPRKV